MVVILLIMKELQQQACGNHLTLYPQRLLFLRREDEMCKTVMYRWVRAVQEYFEVLLSSPYADRKQKVHGNILF